MKLRGITRNVVVLGWVSFFTDLASEMLYPVMPIFLMATLGAGPAVLGLIDGLAEGISSGLRWLGGALSDRWGRRKPLVAAGYLVSALSKPLMGLAAFTGGWGLFLVGRCSDRLGKSVRTAARDALIADSTEPQHRGMAFGLHRAMDTAGAIVGPLVALAVIIWLAGWGPAFASAGTQSFAALPLAWLFLVAAIPGLLSVLLTLAAVKEIRPQAPSAGQTPTRWFAQSYPPALWQLMLANALFSLGNSSDAFLVWRSTEMGLRFGHVILAFALYNTVYALAAGPLGRLSDRAGRKPVLIAGWATYAAVYLGFAALRAPWTPWLLWSVYGLYQAFTEGVSKAMVSDLVPSHQRAGAIGLYHTVSGVGQLLASILAGLLWTVPLAVAGRPLLTPFVIGAGLALAAIPLLAAVPVRRSQPAPAAASA